MLSIPFVLLSFGQWSLWIFLPIAVITLILFSGTLIDQNSIISKTMREYHYILKYTSIISIFLAIYTLTLIPDLVVPEVPSDLGFFDRMAWHGDHPEVERAQGRNMLTIMMVTSVLLLLNLFTLAKYKSPWE